MKFSLISLITILTVFANAQSKEMGCIVENPVKFIQESTISYTYNLDFLKLNNNVGVMPVQCDAYKLRFKKNGEVKDSALWTITKWNKDGLKSSVTYYNRKGEFWISESFKYDKVGFDSVITTSKGGFEFRKYFLNKNNQVYRYVSFKDSSFTSIRFEEEIEFDASGNFKKKTLNFHEDIPRELEVTWHYDSTKREAQVLNNDELTNNLYLNFDSCYIHEGNENEYYPRETKYYFDSKLNIIRILDFCQSKKGKKVYSVSFERNEKGQIVRQFGTSEFGEDLNFTINYNQNGCVSQVKYFLKKEAINYYYKFEND